MAALALITIYLLTMFYSTVAARESSRLLLRGGLALIFVGGVVVVGLLIPLAIAIYLYFAEADFSSASPVLAAGGILELAGGLLLRYCLIKAGVYAPAM